ncbi:OmpH-like outer membrane protein [Candidatus Kinetoplastibacterium oncopeltii TCC290E]|uniref:OmpH-like outer membrane protein n=1 Tax=Candidatus Kinetoplastidibacterium stringomonadis TCC290E TaxID=1208920 RepID=M1LS16_9PROT|nr:OmpH family outer membrane protein [Candidatus Kinetoplastibacterium oncopeltii]AGF48327.1 OmpH-like outer membrane protein [Candidatus Kinetoplastibacterium oncopeltii TCC290E]
MFNFKFDKFICNFSRNTKNKLIFKTLFIFVFFATVPFHSFAEEIKIGFVNTDRILKESNPAKASQKKIEVEFKKRDEELQKLSLSLRSQIEKFDKESLVISENEKIQLQRNLNNLDVDLQRKRREFQEDFNRRRNEEFSSIISMVNESIKNIAEQDNFDLILQDAIAVNPRIDITDQVISLLNK